MEKNDLYKSNTLSYFSLNRLKPHCHYPPTTVDFSNPMYFSFYLGPKPAQLHSSLSLTMTSVTSLLPSCFPQKRYSTFYLDLFIELPFIWALKVYRQDENLVTTGEVYIPFRLLSLSAGIRVSLLPSLQVKIWRLLETHGKQYS